MPSAPCLVAVLLFACMALGLASSGDESPAYRGCVYHCTQGSGSVKHTPRSPLCPADDAEQGSPDLLPAAAPAALRLLRWDCSADCGYRCMWAVQLGHRLPAQKYHGKWPFTRVWGVQEPGSVLASLANLAAHAAGAAALLRLARAAPRAAPRGVRARLYAAHAVLSCASWAASAAFHARDARSTERMDYFAAGAVVVSGLYVTAVRVLPVLRTEPRRRAALAAALAAAYWLRARAMLLVRFDYGGWVGACLALGVTQTVLWLGWALGSAEGQRHPARPHLLWFTALLNAASLLEVLDFPPLTPLELDAHALWHLATVPLWKLWYGFALADAAAAGKSR